jgi:serine/threonine protein kinase
MLGKTVGGRYQIIRYLGGGGFGRTYLAEDWHLPGKPQVVVKQLKPQVNEDKTLTTARRLFNREAEVLYTLGNHNQIPKLFAHFEEHQEFYLVQEFIEGTVLSREMKQGTCFDEDQVIALLMDILTTLDFVHQQQVIHRDIKPSNLIRRNSDQKIVLIDFGAVKQIGGLQTSTDSEGESSLTIAVGSSGYMPNEQLAGKPRYSSDIYAVGMVGLRALTGLYPSQLPDDPRTGEIIWCDKAQVTPEFADILDKMIRYDYRQRYQSASEALVSLRGIAPVNHATIIMPTFKEMGMDGHLVWIERGDELFNQQRYREAIACYDKAIQAVPQDYLVWFKRSMALENMQAYEEAIESYNRVIQIHPDDYLAWFKRGKALEHVQRYEDAVKSYDKVIQIQPDNYWAWHDRGRVLEQSQRLEEAVVSYDRAVQLKPDFQLAAESRKRVLSQLKQVDELYELEHYAEAIESCDRTIADQPNDTLAWLMRGMALEKLHHYESAIESYNQVVQFQPDDHLAWFKRATLLEQLKRYKEAVLSYNKVVQIQPENYWAWNDRGRVLETLRKYEAALVSYDKAVQLKPDFRAAIEGRQRILRYLKHGYAHSKVPVMKANV